MYLSYRNYQCLNEFHSFFNSYKEIVYVDITINSWGKVYDQSLYLFHLERVKAGQIYSTEYLNREKEHIEM